VLSVIKKGDIIVHLEHRSSSNPFT